MNSTEEIAEEQLPVEIIEERRECRSVFSIAIVVSTPSSLELVRRYKK